eukprot:GHVQ01016823.1.p2 GENE.GHVQ01016823.1~~GHVQ01016823.1.p2  ORF type:complete len:138 (-),score=21.72 GHVQ01016823.1:823-1236(-)
MIYIISVVIYAIISAVISAVIYAIISAVISAVIYAILRAVISAVISAGISAGISAVISAYILHICNYQYNMMYHTHGMCGIVWYGAHNVLFTTPHVYPSLILFTQYVYPTSVHTESGWRQQRQIDLSFPHSTDQYGG